MKNLAIAAATLVAASLPFAVVAQELPAPVPMTHVAEIPQKAAPHPKTVKATARKATVVKGSSHAANGGGKSAPGAYRELIGRYAAAYGVPVGLAHAVVRVESNYRANARGGAGEIGLMQIKPATARMLGYRGNASGLFNPETNVKYGMKYLAMAHRLGGGSVCGTILKYNAGHAARRMNPVSAAYCAKVKRHMGA
jgi:soluble lytic murein transglycosylase-like protein